MAKSYVNGQKISGTYCSKCGSQLVCAGKNDKGEYIFACSESFQNGASGHTEVVGEKDLVAKFPHVK